MQRFIILFLMLMLVLPTWQTLAAPDTPISSSGVTQKKTEKGNSADKGTDWSHMKQYKVWDANRKEFTYPENYLEPDKNNAAASSSPDQRAKSDKKKTR
jgi:hypothetical protein